MIATIILGFGLLMIGAVLPIAWKGSVRASELTRAEGASRTAKYYVQKKTRVDGLRDLFVNATNDPLLPPESQTPPGFNVTPDAGIVRGAQGVSYSLSGDFDTIDPDLDGDGNRPRSPPWSWC